MKYTLRPYQEECIRTVNELPDGSRAIVALATGLGKTVCAANFERKGRMLILSHRDELVRQPEKFFDCSFGIEKAEETAHGEEVVSASVQSFYTDKRLSRYSPDDFDLIVVDEAHHAAAPSYKKIINYFRPRKLIGLTATPNRGDGQSLRGVFNDICFSRSLLWGIRNGYLSNVKATIVYSDADISGVSMSAGDYAAGELETALERSEYYRTAASAYLEDDGHNRYHTVIYCVGVGACEIIAKTIREELPKNERDTVQIITGSTPTEERHRIEEDFLSGKVRCIVNCMVLTEGSDLPVIDRVIVCRPTANNTLYTQIVGRGTRLSEGKDHCLVMDVVPETTRSLCSVYSLLGEDIHKIPKDIREKTENEADLLEIDDMLEEIRKQKLGLVKTVQAEYDLFHQLVEEEMKVIKSAAESGAFAHTVAGAICGDQDAESVFDDYGIHYTLGPTSELRYHIDGNENIQIYVSEPDLLDKVSVTAMVNGYRYRTEEPILMEDAVETIRKILEKDGKRNTDIFRWNKAIISSWKGSIATDAQKRFLETLLRRSRISASHNAGMSNKYEASVAIAFLLSAEKHRDGFKEAIRKLTNVRRGKEKDVVAEKIGGTFEDLCERYKDVKIPRTARSVDTSPSSDKIETTPIIVKKSTQFVKSEDTKASERQYNFAQTLLSELRRTISVDIDTRWIYALERAESLSILIDLLLQIRENSGLAYEAGTIWLKEHFDRIGVLSRGEDILFMIRHCRGTIKNEIEAPPAYPLLKNRKNRTETPGTNGEITETQLSIFDGFLKDSVPSISGG